MLQHQITGKDKNCGLIHYMIKNIIVKYNITYNVDMTDFDPNNFLSINS